MGERRFRAMGTDCHVLVHAAVGPAEELADLAMVRVELLEQSWSRFRPTSELNRLNAAAGLGAQPVSADLLLLVQRMHEAWISTGGLFDPTILASMRALGYDTDFEAVAARPAAALDDVRLAAAPGMSAVLVDEMDSTVALPASVGLDPGAIGKGLAADIVAEELLAAGARGVLVNLGGDVSVAGEPADGEPWCIGIEDERLPGDHPARVMETVTLAGRRAGIATSTTLKRRWAQGRRHHVLDPLSGGMSTSDLVQVTVVAATACTAEWSATGALLQAPDDATCWLRSRGLRAILMTNDRVLRVGEEWIHG